jgi:methionyl-tRNA synthetase
MSLRRTLLVTTPIYYVNDVPHVGHAYTTIAADTLTRARRLAGHDVFFLTGTDEHGQNIERIARERGIPEEQHCDEMASAFQKVWARYDIRYDRFIRTTEDIHRRGVLKLWARLRAAKTPDGRDAVYEGTYSGWYCPRCEAFKDEEELRQPGNVCVDHERPCEWTEEANFFFRLSAYEAWLRDLIESDRLHIRPESRKNEVLGVIRQGLKDFSVSRARVKWGIPVPEQPDHVLYVWVDALSNYITALGYADDAEDYGRYWAGADERLHLLGKDIIRFHCLYWPAILHAAGVPVPTREFAQGFITKEGRKLSKTTGNVIDPVALVDWLGSDAARYFLLREAPYGADWDFTDAAFVGRYNADLANDLGNLVSRALTMVARYCEGKVPPRWEPPVPKGVAPARAVDFTEMFATSVCAPSNSLAEKVLGRYEEIDFSGVLTELWSWVGQFNQAIVQVEPWSLAKDPARRAQLEGFLYRLLEGVRLVAVFASPVMPRAAARIFGMLGLGEREPGPDDVAWERLEPRAALGPIAPLFPRQLVLEERVGVRDQLHTRVRAPDAALSKRPATDWKRQKETRVSEKTPPTPAAPATAAATPAPAAAPAPAGDRIDIAEFAKVELRAARITAAEKVAGSKKLVRLLVDLGGETRQVVAGIAESYAPEALVGKTIVLVANLKPAKLMGVESNGMVLAGSIDGKAVLCTFDRDVAPGTKVK